SAVEGEHLADCLARREAQAVVQRRRPVEVNAALAEEAHVATEVFRTGEEEAGFAGVEDFPADGEFLDGGEQAGVDGDGTGRVVEAGRAGQQGGRDEVVEREHGPFSRAGPTAR